jgi:hypothetical protein
MADSVEQFAEHVRQFQAWVLEGSDSGPEAARQALVLVSRLYVAALALPPRQCEDYEVFETITDPDWSNLYHALGARLPFRYYGEVFNPLSMPPEESIIGDVADDLADIFFDIDKGLKCYDAGYRADAIWAWRDRLIFHWGEHATAATRALHCWLAAEHPELLTERGA